MRVILGGRMKGSCLPEYIDVLLEYEIDDSSDIHSFTKNGIVFKKRGK